MKVIAAITADFERTFLGLGSRLQMELRGESVIRRTVRRVRQARELADVHLLVHKNQEAAARSAVAGLDVKVEVHDAAVPPWSRYVASARKWSLDAWRGGLAGTTVYDEFNHPWLLEALARREGADAVVDVPAGAALIEPALLDALVQHYVKVRGEVRLALQQTAPGLSAIIYQAEALSQLAEKTQPPGRMMAYLPDEPHKDIIHQPCLCVTEAAISHAWGRCIADTSTALVRMDRLLGDLMVGGSSPDDSPDALAISRWLTANRHAPLQPLPDEVEVEITTEDPLAESTLRPRGRALGRRGQMDIATFQRIVSELGSGDDRLLVLGGFGDPLLHPDLGEFLRMARASGVLGIAVRTTAVTLDDVAIEALLGAEVDVLNVVIDAASPGTYARVHHADHYERVLANIDRLCSVQHQRKRPCPLIVAELIKTPDTLEEMEAFYDQWTRKAGSAVIAGPSRYAGAWPDRAVVNMAPPTRFACSRLFHRAMVLADGTMTLCDQDYRGSQAIGRVGESNLAELWQSQPLNQVRRHHLAGRYSADGLPLCRACDEWHRP
jgi:hypothetical protein